MITLYKVRKIKLGDIIKSDYDYCPTKLEDDLTWITQQNNNMFRQLKHIMKNEPYQEINQLRNEQKKLRREE